MFGLKSISRRQFAALRVALGLYLVYHFVPLLPYAGELFSSAGTLADGSLSPLFGMLPSPLWLSDTPITAATMILFALLASLFLIAGRRRKIAAPILLYIWACLFCRNPLIANPSLAYVGLILLLSLLIPDHDAPRFGTTDPTQWYFPSGVYWAAWILLAAGYTFSGIIKLQSPSWLDGSALFHLLENPLARTGIFRDVLLSVPSEFLRVMTWLSLAGEILFLPLSIFRRGRFAMWTVMLVMQLGILLVVDFFDLTAAMLLIHLFTFDPDWFPPHEGDTRRILLYDGDCGLCTNSVRFFLEEDRNRIIQYAPLQGETAAELLPKELRDPSQLSTVVLYCGGAGASGAKIPTRSTAIGMALVTIGGFWRIPGWLCLATPRPVRDFGYDIIARNRHRIFPRGACALPTAEERSRFLT